MRTRASNRAGTGRRGRSLARQLGRRSPGATLAKSRSGTGPVPGSEPSAARPGRMGRLTNQPRSAMIPRSAEANRRSSPTRSRHRSGHGNHEPLRSFLFAGPWSRTSRDAASSAICARETRDKKEQNASENHDHVGRGPVRRNAPPSAPSRHRPTLLQHERLHQLSHRRPAQRNRSLRDLRLHPPASLRIGAAAAL
jgi:hypothetical protein